MYYHNATLARNGRRAAKPDEPRAGYYIHTGRATAGTWVRSEEDALSFAAVWACVKVIAETIAGLPWKVAQRMDDGTRRPLQRHRLWRVLNITPNDEMVSVTFRERMAVWALLWGDAYAEIVQDQDGRPAALWPLEPHRVTMERDTAGQLWYRVSNYSGAETYLRPSDMFHVRGLGPNGLQGYYVVAMFREAIGLGLATEAQAAAFFGNDGRPSGFLRYPGHLTHEKAMELLEAFESRHTGPYRRGRIGLLKGGLEYQAVAASNEDAQLDKTRIHQVLEACRIFRVPPHKVAELSRATFSNISEQETAFGRDTIAPWCLRFSQEADAKLFPPPQRQAGFYTYLDVKAIMKGDLRAQMEVFKAGQEMGVLSVNEIRAMMDANPIGPPGDKRVILSNYTTLERIGENPEPPPTPAPDDDGQEESMQDDGPEPRLAAPPRRAAAALQTLLGDLTGWLSRRSRAAIREQAKRHRLGTAQAAEQPFRAWLDKFHADTAALATERLRPLVQAYADLTGMRASVAETAARWGNLLAAQLAEPGQGQWTAAALDSIGPAWAARMAAYLTDIVEDVHDDPGKETNNGDVAG